MSRIMNLRIEFFTVCATLVLISVTPSFGTPWPVERSTVGVPFDDPPKAMPELKVPQGATNLAFGKPVACSDETPLCGNLGQITDGEKISGIDTYVEIGPQGKQYVQIDLQTNASIYAVWIWYKAPIESYFVPYNVVVHVSSNADFIKDVGTVFSCDVNNSLGLGFGKDRHFASSKYGKLIPVAGASGRYVRIYTKGSTYDDLITYVEVEVYGVPVKGEKRAESHASKRFYTPEQLKEMSNRVFECSGCWTNGNILSNRTGH